MGFCSMHSRAGLLGKLTMTPEGLGQKALAIALAIVLEVSAISSSSVHVELILQACRVQWGHETSKDLLYSSRPRQKHDAVPTRDSVIVELWA